MPLIKTKINNYTVVSEDDVITLRIYHDDTRIASCHLIAVSFNAIRLKNFTVDTDVAPRDVLRVIFAWLSDQGYTDLYYERMQKNGLLVERKKNITQLLEKDTNRNRK